MAEWALNFHSLNTMRYPRTELAARLQTDPNTVITNVEYDVNPNAVLAITLHPAGYYYQGARGKLTPHFPYGHAVLDNP